MEGGNVCTFFYLLHLVYITVTCYGCSFTNMSAYKLFCVVLNHILQLGVVCVLFNFVMAASS
jgi:hypothetical protein